MNRTKEILFVSHCILNQNSVVEPLAKNQSLLLKKILPYMERGVGLVQLGCPEMQHLGLKRWGHVKEQFDNPFFRKNIRKMALEKVMVAQEYLNNGYKILGVAGIQGSPSCGTTKTVSSKTWKGNVGNPTLNNEVNLVPGMGIFMEVFKEVLEENGIFLNFFDLIED